jgi:hypothetical protein
VFFGFFELFPRLLDNGVRTFRKIRSHGPLFGPFFDFFFFLKKAKNREISLFSRISGFLPPDELAAAPKFHILTHFPLQNKGKGALLAQFRVFAARGGKRAVLEQKWAKKGVFGSKRGGKWWVLT